MTSYAVISANRANARRSTGPRSAAGKARVGRNALRHGLSLPVLADPVLAPEVEALARKLAGEGARGARHVLAIPVADAQIDLVRIRRVRLELNAQLAAGRDVTRQLLRIERYERRAWSRRQKAIEAFDATIMVEGERLPAEQSRLAEQSRSAD